MMAEERDGIDPLPQVRAARAVLGRVATEMLKNHMHHGIAGAIVSGSAKEQRKPASERIELLIRSPR
jgi:DNA-binding FrmR family transcriptional regulator